MWMGNCLSAICPSAGVLGARMSRPGTPLDKTRFRWQETQRRGPGSPAGQESLIFASSLWPPNQTGVFIRVLSEGS